MLVYRAYSVPFRTFLTFVVILSTVYNGEQQMYYA